MRFSEPSLAAIVGAILLTSLAGCSQSTASPYPVGDSTPPSTGSPAPEVAPTLVVADLQAQLGRQLHDQVGGRWAVECPGARLTTPSTDITCAARDRSGLSAVIAVTVSTAGEYAWRVTESDADAPSIARTTDVNR